MTYPSKPTLLNPNISREAGCLNCNYIMVVTGPNPICEVCNQPLVTILYSAVTGKRITIADF